MISTDRYLKKSDEVSMMPLDSGRYIVGVDEAGRGPLAGPVSVGIVCVREDFDLLAAFPGLNDSKKLSEKKREVLFSLLEEQVALGTVRYIVEMADANDIDQKGIAVCIRALVAQGLEKLLPDPKTGKVYLDGSLHAPPHFEQETVIGGDSLVPAIMLASIAAKVTRDRLVVELAHRYPQYGFEKHKGYGTKTHMDAIRQFGQCEIHRSSFIHLD
jgi:ribonuclease HII